MKRRRRLMSAGDLGADLVRRLDPQGARHTARLVAAWPRIAGPEVDAHTAGLTLRNGELVVLVDSPIWANELSLMGEDYAARLNQDAGETLVHTIRFVPSRAACRGPGDSQGGAPPQQRRPRRRKPLGSDDEERIREATTDIHDDDLRDVVGRVWARSLELSGDESEEDSE